MIHYTRKQIRDTRKLPRALLTNLLRSMFSGQVYSLYIHYKSLKKIIAILSVKEFWYYKNFACGALTLIFI